LKRLALGGYRDEEEDRDKEPDGCVERNNNT